MEQELECQARIEIPAQNFYGKVTNISMKQGDGFKITIFPDPKADRYEGVCFVDLKLEVKDNMILIDNRVIAEINIKKGKYTPDYSLNWKVDKHNEKCPCCGKVK